MESSCALISPRWDVDGVRLLEAYRLQKVGLARTRLAEQPQAVEPMARPPPRPSQTLNEFTVATRDELIERAALTERKRQGHLLGHEDAPRSLARSSVRARRPQRNTYWPPEATLETPTSTKPCGSISPAIVAASG